MRFFNFIFINDLQNYFDIIFLSVFKHVYFQLGEWYFTMQFLAGCFAYSNSALNPLIYAGFNKNFKQGQWAIYLHV